MEVAPIVGYALQVVTNAIKGPVSFDLNRFGDPGREINISSSNILPSTCMSAPAAARFLQPMVAIGNDFLAVPHKDGVGAIVVRTADGRHLGRKRVLGHGEWEAAIDGFEEGSVRANLDHCKAWSAKHIMIWVKTRAISIDPPAVECKVFTVSVVYYRKASCLRGQRGQTRAGGQASVGQQAAFSQRDNPVVQLIS